MNFHLHKTSTENMHWNTVRNLHGNCACRDSARRKKHAKPSHPVREYLSAYAMPVMHTTAPRVPGVDTSAWYMSTTYKY